MNIGSIERLFFSEGKTKFEILILHERDRLVFIDVITDQAEIVYPMIQSGKGHHEMHLSPTSSDTELA